MAASSCSYDEGRTTREADTVARPQPESRSSSPSVCTPACAVCTRHVYHRRPGSARRLPRLGSGADEVWILRPIGQAKSIVVFGHGWSTPLPVGFGPWLAHL